MEVVTPESFKLALRRFASGVTIVTVRSGELTHGMTASSFASASLEPPLIVVCLDKTSQTLQLLRDAGAFAVNVLADGQEELARTFSSRGPKPLEGYSSAASPCGAPLLDGALAWLDCLTHAIVEAGDHDIVLGRVQAAELGAGAPLIYYDGDYRSPGF